VGDQALPAQIAREHELESCIHFATLAYAGELVQDPKLYFENNVQQGVALIGSLLQAGEQPVNPKTKTVACQTALKTLKGAEDEHSVATRLAVTGDGGHHLRAEIHTTHYVTVNLRDKKMAVFV
jgi:hypothetical protein